MNKKARGGMVGFALLTAFLIFFLAALATIEPFKETLDEIRDADNLNCPGVPTFNQTDYDNDSALEKLNVRPVCLVTGLSMVWFIGVFIIAAFMWLVRNWRGVR